MHKKVRKYGKMKETAQGLVEFALVLPLLLVLIFGVIEFGRLLFVYAAVNTASREAARYGSAAGDNGSGTLRYEDCGGMIAAAQRVGILANITGINISYDSGPGTPVDYASCPPGEIDGGRHRVVVAVSSDYQPIIPLLNIGNFTFNAESARTIFNSIEVGRFPPNPAHVANLEGYTVPVPPNKYDVNVQIWIQDEEGDPVENATVAGEWSLPPNPTTSCVTDATGSCWVIKTGVQDNKEISFTVIDIVHTEKAYDPTVNNDPDGNSDGTTICFDFAGTLPPASCP